MISKNTIQLFNTIDEPIRLTYIEYQTKKIEKLWILQYNVIKDPSWPECNCFQDFYSLSNAIKDECIDQHRFSPDIFIQSVVDDADEKFNKDTLSTTVKLNPIVKKFFEDNTYVVKNQKIIDFACNSGDWSFFATQNQASNVVGLDIRTDNILLANSVKQDFDLTDSQVQFLHGDIHDYTNNTNLCADRDTVFLLGIMYHVHDHYEILKSVSQPNIKHVVIETGIYLNERPTIWWKTESTFERVAGWHQNQQEVLVGYPSIQYLNLIMSLLGFENIAQDTYDINVSRQLLEKFNRPRAIMVYKNVNST